jgi:hypothetical protein
MSGDHTLLPEAVDISCERLIRYCYFAHLTLLCAEQPQETMPSNSLPPELTRWGTLFILSCSFLYSLFERRDDSINLLRIWDGFDHPFRDDLEAINVRLQPFMHKLKRVRNGYGFHGSLSRAHEARGFDVFRGSQGQMLCEIIHDMKNLAVRMIHWRMERGPEGQKDFFPVFWAELQGQAP